MQTRRTFLTTTAGAAALALTGPVLAQKKAKPLLSFSTLGCPRWTLTQIITSAVDNGYKGIEFRGLEGELDLPKRPEFSTPERARATRRLLQDKGLTTIGLGSSANLHIADAAKRQQQLDHAKRFIELAEPLGCPYVRVFPNDLPKDQDRQQTIDLIIGALVELGKFAERSPVSVLLESHGKVVDMNLLHQIMSAADHPHVGLIWDIANMWNVTKEPPADVYRKLKKYIRHTHLKDSRTVDGKLQYVLLGEGEVPLAEAINALTAGGYKGYYSFEWEKMWHPDLQDPEVAFPHFAKAVQQYF